MSRNKQQTAPTPTTSEPQIDYGNKLTSYLLAVSVTSPAIVFAMLSKSRVINENLRFRDTLTSHNLKISFNPSIWYLAALRRLATSMYIGETVNKCSNYLENTSFESKAITEILCAGFIGLSEAVLTINTETKQVLKSREESSTKEVIRSHAKASLPYTALRNTLPVMGLFVAREKIKSDEEITPFAATMTSIAGGAIGGILSLPFDVAANISIKTGKRPSFQDVIQKGMFKGAVPRAMQQGIHIGSIFIAGLLYEKFTNSSNNIER